MSTKVGDLIIRILVDGKEGKLQIENFDQAVDRAAQGVETRGQRMQSAFGRVADMGQKLFFTIQGFGAAIGQLDRLSDAANELELSNMRLEGASKLTGVALEKMQADAAKAKEELGLTTKQANAITEELTKLTSKAGDLDKTSDATARLLDLAAARGYDAEAAMQAIGQAIIGIDEGTDKLFGKNPSVIYAEYAKQIGISAGKMDDQQKAQALLNAVMEDGLKVQGSYQTFLGTAAGKQALTAAKAEEAAAKLGLMYNQIKMILFDVAGPLLTWFTSLDQGTAQFIVILVGLTAAMWKVVPAIRGISAATKFLGISVKTALGPISWIIAALGLLWSAWANNLFGIQDITKKVWGYVQASFKGAWEFIKNFAERYISIWKGIFQALKGDFKGGFDTVKQALVGGWDETINEVKGKYAESLEAYKKNAAEKVKVETTTQNEIVDLNKKGEEKKAEIDKKAIERAKERAAYLADLRIANIQDETDRKVAELERWFDEESAKYAGQTDILAELEIARQQRMDAIEKEFDDKQKAEKEKQQQELAAIEKKAEEARVAQREAFWQEYLTGQQSMFAALESGYDTFWNSVTNLEMTGSQRLQAIWQSMKQAFIKSVAERLKAYIKAKIKEEIVTKAAAATNSAIQKKNAVMENAGLVKTIGQNLAAMAARLFSNLAKLGPLGFLAGIGAVVGAVALAKQVIKGVRGFATGGIVEKPELILAGEAGPEIIAPQQDFMDVMSSVALAGLFQGLNVAPPPTAPAQQSLGNTELVDAIRGMTFKFYVGERELAEAVEDGQLEIQAAVV